MSQSFNVSFIIIPQMKRYDYFWKSSYIKECYFYLLPPKKKDSSYSGLYFRWVFCTDKNGLQHQSQR